MVEFYDISFDKIEVIKNLWEENRQYHENTSEYFKELYHSISFDQKVKALSLLPQGMLKITIAKNEDKYIGYCISAINGGKGEVESLHVDAGSRRNGIGHELMKRHIEWLREKGCIIIGVTVSQENESTISFYKKLRF
ncbi:GNAT family N-acetyltransferase [Anaerosolibacter sp.]|uniref:GNAT family N-acetyltransferase n=1 Tax=Anaerosolibacter sp. TaxID=1872527 RepID=UPI0039F058F8